MRTRHTPGPWYWDEDSDREMSVWSGETGALVATARRGREATGDLLSEGEVVVNARLIAAAPDLLEALERIMPLARGWCGVIRRQYGHHSQGSAAADSAYRAARAALAAARGES